MDGERRDAAIRPNQIFAVSLAHALLPEDQARSVVDVVERELLTPYGLRTLAPGDLILTGTPSGVGPIRAGDKLEARIGEWAPLCNSVGIAP